MNAKQGSGDLDTRFEILGEIGRGGFGSVFEARQRSTGQRVALKLLQLRSGVGEPAAERQVARFRREMELYAALSHPNIVRLLDWGETPAGDFFLVLEFVPGRDLAKVILAEGPLQPREALHVMGQVLDALAYAHGEGVVHRDLKPENIMLTAGGARRNALVLDFGVGGFVREAEREKSRLTLSNEIVGTPSYAAPEQLRGEPATAGSDLYAWGLIFLECLTGERVMDGTPQQVLHQQFSDQPVPIPGWLASTAVGRVLARVTAKELARRDVDVGHLFDTLERTRPGDLGRAPGGPRTAGDAVASRSTAFESPSGERRQLTVLSCRLRVTSQASAADAEALDEHIRQRWAEVAEIAERGGGTLASAVADRVLVLFGYPVAHEDDAQRAVAAARRIVEGNQRAGDGADGRARFPLAVHIGIHTGLVTTHQLPDVVGVTPEIATRLDALAPAGEILVSETSWRLVRQRWTAEALGERDLGSAGARAVFRLADAAPTATPSGAGVPTNPLVGRTQELGRLTDLWTQVESGSPRTVLISGEAGIGKSRLASELQRCVPRAQWLAARCVPETRDSPLYPISELLRAVVAETPLPEIVERFGLDAPSAIPLLASLLGLPSDPRFPDPALSPQRRQELTLETLVLLLLRIAERAPTVLLIEDLHWADPTTLALLELVIEEIHATAATEASSPLGLLLLATTRSEFVPPWPLEKLTLLLLQRLTPDQVAEMARAGFHSDRALTPALLSEVVARADGVPLFVEEVAHMMTAAGGSTAEGGAGAARVLEVPGTLRDLLMARLDQLDPRARRIAQLASALGREFDLPLLEAIAGDAAASLRQHLDDLCRSRLLLRRRRTRDEAYAFSHQLLRDTAYESMLRSNRVGVHGRIADALATLFPELCVRQPELLAHHLAAADQPAEAIGQWRRAGEQASARWAHVEATRHLGRALELARAEPPSEARDHLELELLSAQGAGLLATEGYASRSVEQTFGRALELCLERGDTPLPVLYGIWAVHLQRGDRAATDELALRFGALVEQTRDARSLLMAHNCLGVRGFLRGELALGEHHLGAAMERFDPAEHGDVARQFGGCGGLYGHLYMSWCLWIAGKREAALRNQSEVLQLAESLEDPYTLATALIFAIALGHDAGQPDETRAAAERAIQISAEHGFPFWTAIATCGLGWAVMRRGEADAGMAKIREGLTIFRLTGCQVPYAYYLSYLIEGCLATGRIAEGLEVVDEALALTRQNLDRFYEAELLRLQGELLQRDGSPDADVEACFQAGLARAREQGARSLELRAALSLARLLAGGPRAHEGRDALAKAYGFFEEGLEAEDLAAAAAFLASER